MNEVKSLPMKLANSRSPPRKGVRMARCMSVMQLVGRKLHSKKYNSGGTNDRETTG